MLVLAACGGSPKKAPPPPPPAAAPVAAAEPPAPSPPPEPTPPPPSLPGWYATADATVVLGEDGAASIIQKGKAKKGKWDAAASTLTLAGGKPTPVKLEGTALVVAIGGKDVTLPRQPSKFTGTTFANEGGSIQLNEDLTCVHGKAGTPAMCTYVLADGKLTITYKDEPKKKPVVWNVWFDETNKVMHAGKDTFTATE